MAVVKRHSILTFILGLLTGVLLSAGTVMIWMAMTSLDGLKVHDRFGMIERAYVVCSGDMTSDLAPEEPFLYGPATWQGKTCGDGELLIECKNGASLNAGYVTSGPRSEFAIDRECALVVWL